MWIREVNGEEHITPISIQVRLGLKNKQSYKMVTIASSLASMLLSSASERWHCCLQILVPARLGHSENQEDCPVLWQWECGQLQIVSGSTSG